MPISHVYAHSSPGRPIDEWQPLEQHLRNVAARAAEFAAGFDSADWAWNAGLLHDVGKASPRFQIYLRHENAIDDAEYDERGHGRVNHSSAGAALADGLFVKDSVQLGRILAYVIAGHHAGLPDFYPCDGGMGALQRRLCEGKEDLEDIRLTAETLSNDKRHLDKLPAFVKKENFHFWVRMLFSCLVDADFLDTETFMEPERSRQRAGYSDIGKLKELLDSHMKTVTARAADTQVNLTRREVLQACRAASKQNPGLFTLTVPTGGGKTLASMNFALNHAVTHGKVRIIYVIPYTSIIEQTATIFSSIFGPENVIEHHCNFDPDRETPRTKLASENWDAPIVLTTNVQFFESLYAARPSRCRKLHNIVNSVVILDEAQLVPPNLLAPCVAAINALCQNYGVTIVLSTATQPALPNLQSTTEIVPEGADLYTRLKRTEISVPGHLEEKTTWEQIALELSYYDQVLCIVNSRRDCYDLYQSMPPGTVHLSALMCGEHRSRVIADIKARLGRREPLRVISTQLVEAGVDVDFPVVYRALAGLDSIAQAAGRCNREGKPGAIGKVVVFVPPRSAPPGLLHKGECTTRELRSLPNFDPHSPDAYRHYFGLFYRRVNDIGQAYLERLIPSCTSELDVAFRTVGDTFRLIDDRSHRSVFVRYGNASSLLRELKFAGPGRELMRRLQRYTVNVPVSIADCMRRDGLIEEIRPGYLAQCSLSIYREDIGLDIFRDTLPIDDLTGV